MDLQKLAEMLLIPILVSTAFLQYVVKPSVPEKWVTWFRFAALPVGVGVTWLFAELANLGDITPRTMTALGIVAGLASIGAFEELKKIGIVK